MSTLVSLFLSAVILILFFIFGSGFCFFRRVFGIPCPGCGMTRAVFCALRGDFSGAFSYHPLWILLPVFGFLVFRMLFPRLFPFSSSRRYQRVENAVSIVLLTVVLVVYLLRLLSGWRGM